MFCPPYSDNDHGGIPGSVGILAALGVGLYVMSMLLLARQEFVSFGDALRLYSGWAWITASDNSDFYIWFSRLLIFPATHLILAAIAIISLTRSAGNR